MATKLEKPVTRQTSINGKEVLVTISAEGVTYKTLGRRKSVTISHGSAIQTAAQEADKDIQKMLKEDNLI